MTLKECFFLFLWEHPNVIITKLKTNTYKVHMRRALFWVSYSHHASYTCGHLIWRAMPCAGSSMTLQRPTPLLFCIFLDAHSVLHHKPKQDLNAIYNFQSRPRRKMEKYIHKDLHFRVLYKSSLLPPLLIYPINYPLNLEPTEKGNPGTERGLGAVCCSSHMSPGHCDYSLNCSPTSGSFPWGKFCYRSLGGGWSICHVILSHVMLVVLTVIHSSLWHS